MSYTSEIDESIPLIEDWNPTKHYIIVASTKQLISSYVVFESNYRFTEYNEAVLISQSLNDTYSVYLYKMTLPCAFNPFLYIIFKDIEVHAIDILGNTLSDTMILIKRTKNKNDTDFDVSSLLNDSQIPDITYEISDEGDMKIQSYSDSDFCLDMYIKWSKKQYSPFFYIDEFNSNPQVKLVYKNEESAFELIQLSSFTDVQKHTIHEFISDLLLHFIKLFNSAEIFNSTVEHVKLIYKDFYKGQKPFKVFCDLGTLLKKLQSKDSINDVLEKHFITCVDSISKDLVITKVSPSTEVVYIVEFYREFLTITTPSKGSIEIKYQNPRFRYEFVLPF